MIDVYGGTVPTAVPTARRARLPCRRRAGPLGHSCWVWMGR